MVVPARSGGVGGTVTAGITGLCPAPDMWPRPATAGSAVRNLGRSRHPTPLSVLRALQEDRQLAHLPAFPSGSGGGAVASGARPYLAAALRRGGSAGEPWRPRDQGSPLRPLLRHSWHHLLASVP
jgi:hypothetical protein